MSTATAYLPARCAGFFSHAWPIGRAFCVVAAVGAASPLLDAFLYRAFSFEVAHYVFAATGVIVLGLMFWRMERGQFRRDGAAAQGTMGAAVLWVLGLIGSGWCCSHHICMGGHMAHPPYAWWHYGVDGGWVLGVVMASLWTRILRVSLCIAFAGIASFLISYRFLFGSFGGMYEWFPL